MNPFAFIALLIIASFIGASEGFTLSPGTKMAAAPFLTNAVEKSVKARFKSTSRGIGNVETEAAPAPAEINDKIQQPRNNEKKSTSRTNNHGNKGPLAPFVILAKKILGEEELNQLRGKVIAQHSKVIGGFVDTSNTEFGEAVLRALFELADTNNKNGTIEEEELAVALRTLGFELQDKQIRGIFDRADKDENGALDYEEWQKEAPNTLRTNLIKLAKRRNGGDLGFLA